MCAAFSAAVRCWITPPARLETPPQNRPALAPPSACSCAKAASTRLKAGQLVRLLRFANAVLGGGQIADGKRGKACGGGLGSASCGFCAMCHQARPNANCCSSAACTHSAGKAGGACSGNCGSGALGGSAKRCAYRRQPDHCASWAGARRPLRVGCLAGTKCGRRAVFGVAVLQGVCRRSATQHHKPPAAPRDKSNGCRGAGNGGN